MKLGKHKKGTITTQGVASLAIAFLVAAIVMPIGISEVYNANTTGWNAAVITIFTILFPILGIVVLILRMLPKKG